MLEILPLAALREEDGPLVGSDLINLSKLAQANFPIALGIVVIPPQFALNSVLQHLNLKDKEVFEQRLEIFKNEVKKIPLPQVLEKELTKRKLNSQNLWHHLLDLWLAEIRSKIWREGLGKGATGDLTAQAVLFTQKINAFGKAFYDYEAKNVQVNCEGGQLSENQNQELTELVKKGNKKLLLPFIYSWVIENRNLKITKIQPFTQVAEKNLDQKLTTARFENPIKYQSTVKVFLHLNETFCNESGVDGFFISSEKILDWDRKVLQLLEAAVIPTASGVVYQLSDTQDRFGGLKGTLKLIHDQSPLEKDTQAIKFIRHKKGLLNCHVGIPFCRSVEEYLELKRQLQTFGLSRTSSLNYYLELSVPENLLNLEKYIEAGFDKAILNLDSLTGFLGGFDPEHQESFYYQKQILSLLKFIEPALKTLHKNNMAFLVKGKISLHDDVLSFLLEEGLWGIIVPHGEISSIFQRINLLEQRIVRHGSASQNETTKHILPLV